MVENKSTEEQKPLTAMLHRLRPVSAGIVVGFAITTCGTAGLILVGVAVVVLLAGCWSDSS